MRKELHVPDTDSAAYRNYKAQAVLYLTQQIYNYQHFSVIMYAAQLGATEMLQALFNIDHVYR